MKLNSLALMAAIGVIGLCVSAGCATGAESAAPATAPKTETKETSQNLNSSPISEGMSTVSFKVDGMTCGGCRGEVDQVLSSAPGVKECEVKESGQVTVTFDSTKMDKKDLVALVNDKTDFKAAL